MREQRHIDSQLIRVRTALALAQAQMLEAGSSNAIYDGSDDRIVANVREIQIAAFPFDEVMGASDDALQRWLVSAIINEFGDRRPRPFREPEV